MQLHTYQLAQGQDGAFEIGLSNRYSTDSDGIAESLGLQASSKVELEQGDHLLRWFKLYDDED
jgi:hypothetical protein